MTPKPQTSKAYFTFLTIIHSAMLGMQITFAAVVYYVTATGQPDKDADSLNEIFQYLVPALMISTYLGGSFYVKSQLKELRAMPDLKDKLSAYRGVFLVKLGLLEIPALFSIVCCLVTSNYIFLGFAGLIIIVFLLHRPTQFSVANDLDLNSTDRALLGNPDAVVAEIKQREM